ncbi:MAG: flagellar biosynthetic protein FliQ [Azospirillum brasilense]|nr:MAG: flagellar biosynthetic protein FliQ [Azospirillum brasilense]
MDSIEVINIVREGIWVLVLVSAPLMITALVVGLAVSLVQALTQIQEMTLTFVPKILAMLFVMMLTMPFMLQALQDYTEELFTRIATME